MAEAFFDWRKGDELGNTTLENTSPQELITEIFTYLRVVGVTEYPVIVSLRTDRREGSRIVDFHEDGTLTSALIGDVIKPEDL